MTIKLAILMDAIESIDPKHDSSFSMLLAAQKKGWQLYYFQQQDLYVEQNNVKAFAQELTVNDTEDFYQFAMKKHYSLDEFDIVLMRKDPPFNIHYIYSTFLLEQAERKGVLVVNKPQSLRDANEKLLTLWFPDCCPETLVSSNKKLIKQFWQQQGDVILKPLDGMGGQSIFYAGKDETNINVIIETLTEQETMPIMVQQYLSAIKTEGDKRILMINGEPVSHTLVRIPGNGDIRGNMAVGANVKVLPLTEHEKNLCAKIGPTLRDKGLLFVGLDVIGGFVTEINVTSPTGIQELNRLADLNVAGDLIDCLERVNR